ncbi:MAG: Transportin-1, partial [Marteilia pararefringens]
EFNESNAFVAINVFSQSSSSSEDPYDLIFNRWNARKSASLTLEMLANTFGENVAKKFFFIIDYYMKKEHWKYVEAANLIFGAISDGLSDVVEEYLPQVIPLVFSAAYSGKIFVLRSTSVWTLSRYSTFISNTDVYTEEYIKILIALISDRNKRVQLAAFYALVQLQNVLQFEILPYFDEIVSSISKCMPYYDLVTFSSVSLYLLSVLETLHS